MSVFIKNGFLVIMDKNKNESNESFTKRGWFTVSQEPNNTKKFELVEKFSNMWINKKNLKCKYNQDIEKKLKN